MHLNNFIPNIISSTTNDNYHSITKKRMERFSPNGHLLSITDVRTTHFDEFSPSFASTNTRNKPVNTFDDRNKWVPLNRNEGDYNYTTIHTVKYLPEQPKFQNFNHKPNSVNEKWYPIKKVERVIEREPQEIRREYDSVPGSNSDAFKIIDGYTRNTSILKNSTFGAPSKVYFKEPLDCLIDEINKIRVSTLRRPLQPSVRLADIAAQWARQLAERGEFRTDHSRKMNIWMGSKVQVSIAHVWCDEAEEFRTHNFLNDENVEWVGVASAFSQYYRQFVVVAVYE